MCVLLVDRECVCVMRGGEAVNVRARQVRLVCSAASGALASHMCLLCVPGMTRAPAVPAVPVAWLLRGAWLPVQHSVCPCKS